jgi:acyl carrier protein
LDDIKKIISETFNYDVDKIDNDTGPDSINEWDSLGHFRLINEIETKYNIMLNPNDIFQITNVGDIINILKKYF